MSLKKFLGERLLKQLCYEQSSARIEEKQRKREHLLFERAGISPLQQQFVKEEGKEQNRNPL